MSHSDVGFKSGGMMCQHGDRKYISQRERESMKIQKGALIISNGVKWIGKQEKERREQINKHIYNRQNFIKLVTNTKSLI